MSKRKTEEKRLFKSGFRLRSSHWIVDEQDRILIGPGRAELLSHVETTGSIRQAARIMKISYKAAWGKIKSTQDHLNIRIVISDRKAGTRLTDAGRNLLNHYRRLNSQCIAADDKLFFKMVEQPHQQAY